MIVRTYSADVVNRATAQYSDEIVGFDVDNWLNVQGNIALCTENGDVALFEEESSGVVTGHYFFFVRGRDAINLSRVVLNEIFTGPYGIKVIRGLTPLDNKGALWMSRHVGFKSYGTIKTPVGPCMLFILTKDEYLEESH